MTLEDAEFSTSQGQTRLDIYARFHVMEGIVYVSQTTLHARRAGSRALIEGKLLPASDMDAEGSSYVEDEVAELRLRFEVPTQDNLEIVYDYDDAELAVWQVN